MGPKRTDPWSNPASSRFGCFRRRARCHSPSAKAKSRQKPTVSVSGPQLVIS